MIPRLLKTKEVCGALGVSRRTLYNIMARDERMTPIRIGKTLRWHEQKVAAFTATGSDAKNMGVSMGSGGHS